MIQLWVKSKLAEKCRNLFLLTMITSMSNLQESGLLTSPERQQHTCHPSCYNPDCYCVFGTSAEWPIPGSACRPNIAVAELAMSDGRVVLINADRAVSCHRWLSPKDLPAFTFSGNAEPGYSVEADPNPPRLLGTPFAADLDCSKCYCVLPGGQV